ncbi:MAG: tyrosine-protein phosphatase [Acidobacteriaceae bacterium]|nr:tyrosine-protein phosphatase [Acidobacteriaceae bacterium]
MRPTAVFALIVLAGFSGAAEPPAAHVRNFDRVNEHLFRGGEPTLVGLQELGAMGVKLDIDLREVGEGTEIEKQAAEKLGIKYVNIPFPPLSAPGKERIERALSLLLSNESEAAFVHCRRGKDRTGTVIACYRIQHDHWDNQKALAEAKQHGMSFTERGMKAYILHFTPISISAAVSSLGSQ